jgi:hypothetical protein
LKNFFLLFLCLKAWLISELLCNCQPFYDSRRSRLSTHKKSVRSDSGAYSHSKRHYDGQTEKRKMINLALNFIKHVQSLRNAVCVCQRSFFECLGRWLRAAELSLIYQSRGLGIDKAWKVDCGLR